MTISKKKLKQKTYVKKKNWGNPLNLVKDIKLKYTTSTSTFTHRQKTGGGRSSLKCMMLLMKASNHKQTLMTL